jgi:Fic family protein
LLPPQPALDFAELFSLLDLANQALGRLDGLHATLPDTTLLLHFYNLREAVLSSQIEGTQSSLSEVLLFENEVSRKGGDAEEVSNYVAAMQHGLQRIRGGLPFCNRLLKEMHAILLRTGRGSEKPEKGEFRRSQNWIGGTRPGNAVYVPPPVAEMEEVMSELERFLHRETGRLPLLVDIALAHVQFESAHPFLDGNGRIGRLLITLLLCDRGVLKEPSLYMSLYLKRNRDRYYELLQRTRTNGEWHEWITFFLEGIRVTADEACQMARRIQQLFLDDRRSIHSSGAKASMKLLHSYLERRPVTTLPAAAEQTGLSLATVGTSMEKLATAGIVQEVTQRRRGRIFAYTRFLAILNEGTTDPFPS